MKILDCTLRDGGYYNNWDFLPEVVNAYLAAMAAAKIDFVELGLRNFSQDIFLGAFAYTTETYINSLDLPFGPTYGVMVDAKTILNSELPIEEAINALFVPASESKIGLVRIAAHFAEVEKSGPIVKQLKSMGYIVGYNLMQAGGKSSELIADKANQITKWGGLDVLYFADSLGNMDSVEVERIVKALHMEWSGPLGIHTHNNLGKGLDNTISANFFGVTWLDVTITGMGRGAGNTQTEIFLAFLDKKGSSKYQSKPIYELVIRYFESMQKHYGWGSNLLYVLGAQNDVHPTYIQNLLSNTHYGTNEIIGAIDYLSKLDGTTSYNGSILNTALSFNTSDSIISGSTEIQSLFDNANVLIITNGPSTLKYASAIEIYIKTVNPIVISINITDSIPEDLIDYYVISHNSKFLADASRYQKLNKPIILPKHRFSDCELDELNNKLIDFGLVIESNVLVTNKTHAVIPFDITAAYILAILLESKPKSISSVGFDGFDSHDPRHQEMVVILELYKKSNLSCEIISLTPTTYPMSKGSIYAPNL
jgi:4-hydroxy 2-oxovalerate aldolase